MIFSGVELAVELGEGPRYGYVHVAGCSDLRDPLPLGRVPGLAALPAAVAGETGREVVDFADIVMANCARRALR